MPLHPDEVQDAQLLADTIGSGRDCALLEAIDQLTGERKVMLCLTDRDKDGSLSLYPIAILRQPREDLATRYKPVSENVQVVPVEDNDSGMVVC